MSEAEKKYRTIVENAAGGIYQISPEGRLLSANPALAKIFGFNNAKELLAGIYDINREVYKDHELRQKFLDNVKRSEDVVYQEMIQTIVVMIVVRNFRKKIELG